MESIILIAPPAAGKGTQSALLCAKYNLAHISTGDLLRAEVSKKSKLGNELAKIMATGGLVSDDIIVELLRNRLKEEDCKKGYILDGFPRTLAQAKSYQNMLKEEGKELGKVIVIDVPKEMLKKRIVGRVSCPNCGEVYNELIKEAMPKEVNTCDKCHGTLTKRSDDNAESFETRYQTYLDMTAPLINYYKDLNILATVDGSISKTDTFNQIEKVLGVDGID